MTLEVLSFIFGALLVLIGVLGGGFEAKEIKVPKVSSLVRLFSLAIGILFIGGGIYISNQKGLQEPTSSRTRSNVERVQITILDELHEYQIAQGYEGQTEVTLNGRNVGSITINQSFPESFITVSLPANGPHRYVIETKASWKENGYLVRVHCVGDGTIYADAGKKFMIQGRLDGDKCTLWLEEV